MKRQFVSKDYTMKNKILLIVPCYNEEKRLNILAFTSSHSNLHFIFANDGSTDSTLKILNNIKNESRFFVFNSNQNLGKANIIQAAYHFAKNNLDINSYEWIGYWDADLATPLLEIDKMINANDQNIYKSIWGSRVSRLGANIKRSPVRHYLGRVFATIISLLLNIRTYDSQCGAKLFDKEYAEMAFANPFQSKWIFDVEILLRLDQNKIMEFPLTIWTPVNPLIPNNLSRESVVENLAVFVLF